MSVVISRCVSLDPGIDVYSTLEDRALTDWVLTTFNTLALYKVHGSSEKIRQFVAHTHKVENPPIDLFVECHEQIEITSRGEIIPESGTKEGHSNDPISLAEVLKADHGQFNWGNADDHDRTSRRCVRFYRHVITNWCQIERLGPGLSLVFAPGHQ